jgi:hypothetical protein
MSSSKGLSEITEKIKRKIKKSHEMNLDEDLGFPRINLDFSDYNKYGNCHSGSNYYPSGIINNNVDKPKDTDVKLNGLNIQIGQIMNSLNSFERSIENDFEELEKYIEDKIETELNNDSQFKE